MVGRGELTEEAWSMIAPLLPKGRGRRGGQWRDHRTVITRTRPTRLIADKGYSYPRCRRLLRRRQIPHTGPERRDQRARRVTQPGRPLAFNRVTTPVGMWSSAVSIGTSSDVDWRRAMKSAPPTTGRCSGSAGPVRISRAQTLARQAATHADAGRRSAPCAEGTQVRRRNSGSATVTGSFESRCGERRPSALNAATSSPRRAGPYLRVGE